MLELVPVTWTQARRFVNAHHAHNEAPTVWKFGVGIESDGVLVGVAIVSNPSARMLDQVRGVEITRVCIDQAGIHKNAASMLYGAACRMATAGGFRVAWTYTLESEDAASVKAAGFTLDAELGSRPSWSTPSRPRNDETLFGPKKRPTGPKRRWRRELVRA